MRREKLLASVELVIGLGMLVGFVVLLLVPALGRVIVELPWTVGTPRALPGFGVNPHWVAEARYAPSLVVLSACAALAVCYRWLTSRRRS
jgi:uncharacterized BrkB/YihY/UPF0761 family membrane protein